MRIEPPRAPARIEPFLKDLAALWKKHPDMRLMQLLTTQALPGEIPFYLEDDVLLSRIRQDLP